MVSKSDTEWDGAEGLCGQQYDLSACHYCNVPGAATFLYEKISMAHIFYLVAGITMVSVIVESRIMRKRKKHRTIIPGSSIVRISGKDFII